MEQIGAVVATVVLVVACVVVITKVMSGIRAAGARVAVAVVIIVVGVGLVVAGDVGGWEVQSCGATASCPHPSPPDRIVVAGDRP
jgi:hypothetical protein